MTCLEYISVTKCFRVCETIAHLVRSCHGSGVVAVQGGDGRAHAGDGAAAAGADPLPRLDRQPARSRLALPAGQPDASVRPLRVRAQRRRATLAS